MKQRTKKQRISTCQEEKKEDKNKFPTVTNVIVLRIQNCMTKATTQQVNHQVG